MLRLHCLTIDNFGPFKGEQRIAFPSENGVTIIYGENMRGKTSLSHAIRYAFFGKVRDRGYRDTSLHQISNWESADEGKYGFKVVLSFEYNGEQYELTRSCTPRSALLFQPTSDQDYIEECFLRCSGDVLSPDQRNIRLNQIMPEQVSRFFLFDGELLQEYEELLRDESDMGRRIKEAIERILGVPILTSARACLRDLLQAAQKQESKMAQRDQKTQALGNHLADLTLRQTVFEEEIEKQKAELEGLRDRKASIEETLKKTERFASLIDERDRLEKEITDLDRRQKQKEEKLKEIMADAWRSMLSKRVKETHDGIEQRIQSLQEQITRKAIRRETAKRITQALQEDRCPTCLRSLDEDTRRHLSALLDLEPLDEQFEGTDELQKLSALKQVLRNFPTIDIATSVQEITDTLDLCIVDRASKLDRIAEIDDNIRNLDQSEIRKIRSEYSEILKEIMLLEEGIKQSSEDIRNNEESIKDIQKQLGKEKGVDLVKERSKRELYGNLCNLFSEGVDVYRERLRKQVEKDATALFLQLTSEPDYAGLRINENYGLLIVHKDEHIIPVRSAGAEHIVALSLMGALQRNAPLQGPIIMDSPFGRLDEIHTTKVVQALPNMADQVVLLVYEAELKPQTARNQLLGKLRSEYKMVRKTARYTTIERYEE